MRKETAATPSTSFFQRIWIKSSGRTVKKAYKPRLKQNSPDRTKRKNDIFLQIMLKTVYDFKFESKSSDSAKSESEDLLSLPFFVSQAFIDMAGNPVFLLYVFEYAAGFSNRTESQKHTFDMERSVYVIAVSS